MSDDHERGEYRALAHLIAGMPRPPWLARRFQALDALTRAGQVEVLQAVRRLEPERAWAQVLVAAGLPPEPAPAEAMTAPGRAGHRLSPETPEHRVAVLLGLRDGERPVDLAARLGLGRDIVDRALRFLARWAAVRTQEGRWYPVREARPW